MAGQVIVRQLGPNITIRYRDVPVFAPERARRAIFELARTFFELGLQEIAGRISDEAPVGVTGNLAQSFGGSEFGGQELLGTTIESLEGRVFSSLPYAIVIDQGRTPGARMPPVDAIALWVERVLGISSEFDDAELEDVAFLIARAIARRGIVGRKFVEKGVQQALPTVEGIFQALADAIGNALVSPEGGGVSPPPGGVGL